MLKSVLVFFCLLSVQYLWAQEERKIPAEKLTEIDGVTYVEGEKQPFTGTSFQNHTNGNIGMAGTYKNGKKEGDWVWWYENGEKQRITQYVGGEKHGKCIWWYNTGVKKSEIIFENNRNIRQLSWDKNGIKTKNPSFSSFS
ncbi:MAG: hypothetical protein ABIJ97_18110 [Bacteroidota bacterium]